MSYFLNIQIRFRFKKIALFSKLSEKKDIYEVVATKY